MESLHCNCCVHQTPTEMFAEGAAHQSVLILFLYLSICTQSQAVQMGPGEILLRYCRVCQDGVYNSTIRTSKLTRSKTLFSMELKTKYPIDKNMKVHLIVFIWTNGGWKSNFYKAKFGDFCNTFMKNVPNVFARMAKDSNTTAKCPLVSERYVMKDVVIDLDDFHIPKSLLPYGKLRVDITSYYKKEKVNCCTCVIEIVPARKS